ncbi:hypothetical protein ETAA8_58560 [Anatilimnocola aggregata]|uniref:Uncharacterized protein n=1 Tax=Anatilimnocola aggregata TaxID=2528021 RepID=A0A517YKH2_9BACT|nr:CpsD/CapB family tyrosine-protein kinase [Anatilimnocola aggregata]QDU30708.1 hypothetical protein ETAA8_58560 [Anatilimnocola aggregata]
MSRMRQALKNLEARFPSAGSQLPYGTESTIPHYVGPLQGLVDSSCAHLVVQPVIAENVRVALAEPASRPPQPSLEDYLQQRTMPRPEVMEAPAPVVPPAPTAAPVSNAPLATDADAPAWKLNGPKQELSALEQTMVRLLADPRFAGAYGDLAERLSQDYAERAVSSFALAAIEPWRGHTELALGIAGMIADRGGDILLVDGGGSGSTLSFEMGLPRAPGLAQWLAAPNSWSKWVQPTGLRNLYFLPAGTGEPAADRDWGLVLPSLRNTFRQVVFHTIESPPARLELLTRAATATYLTVPLGIAETIPAQQMLTRLRSKGARVLGCIAAQASGS